MKKLYSFLVVLSFWGGGLSASLTRTKSLQPPPTPIKKRWPLRVIQRPSLPVPLSVRIGFAGPPPTPLKKRLELSSGYQDEQTSEAPAKVAPPPNPFYTQQTKPFRERLPDEVPLEQVILNDLISYPSYLVRDYKLFEQQPGNEQKIIKMVIGNQERLRRELLSQDRLASLEFLYKRLSLPVFKQTMSYDTWPVELQLAFALHLGDEMTVTQLYEQLGHEQFVELMCSKVEVHSLHDAALTPLKRLYDSKQLTDVDLMQIYMSADENFEDNFEIALAALYKIVGHDRFAQFAREHIAVNVDESSSVHATLMKFMRNKEVASYADGV